MLPHATTAALLLFGRGDAVIELAGVALLKIGAAAAADQQGIAAKHPVGHHVADAAGGMARCMLLQPNK